MFEFGTIWCYFLRSNDRFNLQLITKIKLQGIAYIHVQASTLIKCLTGVEAFVLRVYVFTTRKWRWKSIFTFPKFSFHWKMNTQKNKDELIRASNERRHTNCSLWTKGILKKTYHRHRKTDVFGFSNATSDSLK